MKGRAMKKPKRKRGRPKGTLRGITPARTIRVNAAEWRRMNELAAAEGLSVSAYLRRRGLGK
jgi:hypothetical protein